jgi:hypothetical protein
MKMDINQDIKNLIFNAQPDHLNIRDEHRQLLELFLDNPGEENAAKLFDFIHKVHHKQTLFNSMNQLRDYEIGFTKILDLRKHYCHSANVYALGLAMYNGANALRMALSTKRHSSENIEDQKGSFLFRWSLTACNHDLENSLQMSVESFNQYSARINGLNSKQANLLSIDQDIFQKLNFMPILKPTENIGIEKKDTALGLISFFLTDYQGGKSRVKFETLQRYLEQVIILNLKRGLVDHGVFSALIVLKRIHELYEENVKWNTKDFYYEAVDSATAIFLHNIYRFTDLKQIFGQGKYHYKFPSPLGYLLYVCDVMCEWSRKDHDERNSFGLSVTKERLIFKINREFKQRIDEANKIIDHRPLITIQWQS